MARPRKKIDPEQVKKLAAIQCSYAEMASVLQCNESTLTRRFAQAIKEGREQGCASLKRKQFEIAMQGNVGMLIWLGKQFLGQRDKHEHEGHIQQTHYVSEKQQVFVEKQKANQVRLDLIVQRQQRDVPQAVN